MLLAALLLALMVALARRTLTAAHPTHHQQAVQMANMAGHHATTPEVKKLATAIKAAQDPEINTLSGRLTNWGKPVPTPSHGDRGTHEMPGLMSEDEMSDLGNADGAMFDRMWAQMMIEHHQGRGHHGQDRTARRSRPTARPDRLSDRRPGHESGRPTHDPTARTHHHALESRDWRSC
ncbi:DUF305 domain-containing protein [Kribbella sp. NPDC048928]|uniref:DUF305 domain-containing protein n=1 Tax=Kribbella sp. NPDC048928 TaxID=3364111 RepID=UPI0037208F9C